MLLYCKEWSRQTLTVKNIKTVLALLTEGEYNRLHGNWGEKTLHKSTPRHLEVPCS